MDLRKKLRHELTYLITMLERTETNQQQLEEFYKFVYAIMELVYNS